MSMATSPPVGPIVVIRVALRCLLCARPLGTVVVPRWPWLGRASFTPAGGAPAVEIPDWRRLRCVACGGNAYPDEVTPVRIYPRVPFDDWRPRRGRPPRWLVAQREAARAAERA
jgi:hypothetical protein